MNLHSFDLNLLLVFDAVMREGSVTRAGNAVGLSQPAVSNALGRLRHHLGDDLFVRRSDGMHATPRAQELAEPVRTILERLEGLLDPVDFDPETSDREFRFFTTDYASTVIMPKIVAHLSRVAPNINLRIMPIEAGTISHTGQVDFDFAIAMHRDLSAQFDFFNLIDDDYVVLMRRGHPLAEGPLTVRRYAAASHILVSPIGDNRGFVDDALAEKGLRRRVAMSIGQFSVTPPIIAASDLILTAPRTLGDTYAALYDLEERPSPVRGPPAYTRCDLIWHRQLSSHAAHHWFRAQMKVLFSV